MFGKMPQHLVFGPELWPFDLCEDDIPDAVTRAPALVKDNTYFLQTQQMASRTQQRLKHTLDILLTTDMALARDLAYFGDSERSLQQILDAYDMTAEDLQTRMEDKDFRLMVKTIRKDMEKDVNGMLRSRAKMYLDAEMDLIHEAVINRGEKLSDRIRGFQMMAQLADAIPRNEGGGQSAGAPVGPAANITFNIGTNSPHAVELQRVFEGKAERVEENDG